MSYSYALSGEQKRLEQTHQIYGTRQCIRLWEEGKGFEYGLVKSGFDSQRYIELMDWEAEKAAQTLV